MEGIEQKIRAAAERLAKASDARHRAEVAVREATIALNNALRAESEAREALLTATADCVDQYREVPASTFVLIPPIAGHATAAPS